MKTNSLKSLLLLLLVLLTTAVVAQPGHGRGNKPAHKEVAAYYQQNILPVLRQQRQKLETQLSADDKTQLAAYRSQLKDLRQQGKALRNSLNPAGAAQPELTDAQKEQVQQLRSRSRGVMLSVAQMAQKYDAAIMALAKEVQPQKEKWTADLKAIAGKYAADSTGRAGHGQHRWGQGAFFRPAMFLLMDPDAPQRGEERGVGSNVYPNPANTTSQLEYSVKKAGPVTIDLLDGQGNTMRTLLQNTTQEKGPHTLAANVGDLPAGTYYYKITTRSGVETKRFVKN